MNSRRRSGIAVKLTVRRTLENCLFRTEFQTKVLATLKNRQPETVILTLTDVQPILPVIKGIVDNINCTLIMAQTQGDYTAERRTPRYVCRSLYSLLRPLNLPIMRYCHLKVITLESDHRIIWLKRLVDSHVAR